MDSEKVENGCNSSFYACWSAVVEAFLILCFSNAYVDFLDECFKCLVFVLSLYGIHLL